MWLVRHPSLTWVSAALLLVAGGLQVHVSMVHVASQDLGIGIQQGQLILPEARHIAHRSGIPPRATSSSQS